MRPAFRALFLPLLLTVLFAGSASAAEPQSVSVGGYVFPPFVEYGPESGWTGLTIDLIAALNASQEQYDFEFFPTSATRRYHDFVNGRFDMLFFESPHWGWKNQLIVSLPGPRVGGEVFIAAAQPGRGQDYFVSLHGKRIALFSGYHYAFAGYNSNKNYLRQTHNAIITFSHESSMQMVLRNRVDLAVIPQGFLQRYLDGQPEYRSQLLISAKPDQYYRHILIKRESSEPRLSELASLLKRLDEEGTMQELLARHGLLIFEE
ncbi:substrate-binding periplasmic protein [Halopseudomonas sp.]|uniref:substrate-binding periplasmic protein n=1 Tax=Halopseudomonas sp. TaxID=2901191 RepID=UPI003562E4DA